MSISLDSISHKKLFFYCLAFLGISLSLIIIIMIYSYIINTISEKILSSISKLFFKNIYTKLNNRNSEINKDIYELRIKKNIKNRIIKSILKWIKSIILLSLVLYLILALTKILIKDEAFAYTIITLSIFVLSNQITSFVRSSWANDKHILKPHIAIGEFITINNESGKVTIIGDKFFWIEQKQNKYKTITRFPLTMLDTCKLKKYISINMNPTKITIEEEEYYII